MKNSLLIVMLSYLLILGCKTVESRWHDTQEQDTISGYEEFVGEYPNSPYTSDARSKIADKQAIMAKELSLKKEQAKELFISWRNTGDSKFLEKLHELMKELDLTKKDLEIYFGQPDNIKKEKGAEFWEWGRSNQSGYYYFGYIISGPGYLQSYIGKRSN